MNTPACHTDNLRKHHFKVRQRDGNYCRMCLQRVAATHMHVHCIDGDTANERHENLITLCARCHGIAHATPRQSRAYLQKAMLPA